MNTIDTKFAYELTEPEMFEYVRRIREQRLLKREEHVERAVDYVVSIWTAEKEHPVGTRSWSFELPTARPSISPVYVGELDTYSAPTVLAAPGHVHVSCYPWMTEPEVRYVAREQILEQTEWDG